MRGLPGVLLALALVAIATPFVVLARVKLHLHSPEIAYLIPVMIAAVYWGMLPALVTALAGISASAFLLYKPIYSLQVSDRQELLSLLLMTSVGVVTARLASGMHHQAVAAEKARDDLSRLYAFSRQLATADTAEAIHDAIRRHIAAGIGQRTVLFDVATSLHEFVPAGIRPAIQSAQHGRDRRPSFTIVDTVSGSTWIVHRITQGLASPLIVAVDVGGAGAAEIDALQRHTTAVLAEAASMLERMEIAKAIEAARTRTEATALREALIGSVSHGLRTPLASVVGSTSVLLAAPAVAANPQLSDLARMVLAEARRLDADIQRLLDAAAIGATGVEPKLVSVEPSDLIAAAVASTRKAHRSKAIEIDCEADLAFAHVDPALATQALVEVLDNALKYSRSDSVVVVRCRGARGRIAFEVIDQGIGIAAADRLRVFDKFYRSAAAQVSARGSGLGLWIARAFVTACHGTIEITAVEETAGAIVRIEFPARSEDDGRSLELDDD